MSCLSESFPAFEGTDLNVWHYELEQNVTSVPGTLTIQFFITTSDGETIPTEAFTKHVAGGVISLEFPDAPCADTYSQILDYLSRLNVSYDDFVAAKNAALQA